MGGGSCQRRGAEGAVAVATVCGRRRMALSTERRGVAEGAKDEPQIDNHKYECMSSMEGGVGERRKGRGGGICGRKEVGGEGLLLVRLVIYSRFSDLVA